MYRQLNSIDPSLCIHPNPQTLRVTSNKWNQTRSPQDQLPTQIKYDV